MNTLCRVVALGLKRPCSFIKKTGGTWSQSRNKFDAEPKEPTSGSLEELSGENREEINYTVSQEDFKWVERLFPPSMVPHPPKHDQYPTPSGWIAPSETVPEKPYFVRRTRFHTLPILEVEKPKRSNRWLTVIRNVEGDILALEKELVEVVQPYLDFDPATRIHELTQTIWIKGLHKEVIEKHLYDLGF